MIRPESSTAKLPYGTDEHTIAGGLADKPLELVKCATVGLEVPAYADLIPITKER